jgi:hypothetical protein
MAAVSIIQVEFLEDALIKPWEASSDGPPIVIFLSRNLYKKMGPVGINATETF